jgi:hypothetical protein
LQNNNKHTTNLFNKHASNKAVLFFVFLLFFQLISKSETTYGYCNVKDKKGGTDIYTLFGKTSFDCLVLDQNWQQVLLKVWVKKNKVYDDQQILAQAKFYNENRIQIGQALIDFTPYKFINEIDSYYVFEISGFMQQACIDPSSIPELDINKILAAARQNESFETFKSHLKKFNYSHIDSNSKYKSFIIKEPDFKKQSVSPRILIVFYKNELIAIFYSREIMANLYDSIEMGSQYKLIYNSKFTEETKSEMMTIYKKQIPSN